MIPRLDQCLMPRIRAEHDADVNGGDGGRERDSDSQNTTGETTLSTPPRAPLQVFQHALQSAPSGLVWSGLVVARPSTAAVLP